EAGGENPLHKEDRGARAPRAVTTRRRRKGGVRGRRFSACRVHEATDRTGGTPHVCAARLLAAKSESQKRHRQRSRNQASDRRGAQLGRVWPPEAVALVQLILSASLVSSSSS
uniref:Uncharacterized protein n=1 Tax=Triticum urartu TaxID=4572 RepID=A0A8R7PI51_TRIUA